LLPAWETHIFVSINKIIPFKGAGNMENPALKFVFERRSIRRFKQKTVPRRLINRIVDAGQRAPTACGMQGYSLILVTDRKLREEVYKAIGKQKCMEEAPTWILVCADMARQLRLFETLGVKTKIEPLSKFIPAVVDAALVAENMVIAAEMFGLGSVFIGSVWAEMKRVADVFGLPKNVCPIVLVCIGYPDESPPTRPRWPREAVLHENKYKMPSKTLMKDYYEKANEQLVKMRYFPKSVHNWAEHWQRKFPPKEMKVWEAQLRKDLKALGFLP
jgi:nitroreductase